METITLIAFAILFADVYYKLNKSETKQKISETEERIEDIDSRLKSVEFTLDDIEYENLYKQLIELDAEIVDAEFRGYVKYKNHYVCSYNPYIYDSRKSAMKDVIKKVEELKDFEATFNDNLTNNQ